MPDLPTIVLDSCVLIPSRMRDYLLSLAAEQCYRPVWNDVILTEVAYRERERHREFGLSQTKANQMAAALIAQMTKAFDDSLIDDWQRLEGTFGLPDPDDEHVLATAVTASASVIVTTNLVHFPERALPISIQAMSPADFTARIARTMPGQAKRPNTQLGKFKPLTMWSRISRSHVLNRDDESDAAGPARSGSFWLKNHGAARAGRANHVLVRFAMWTSPSMTGTSTRTPTVVARATGLLAPNRATATATDSSKKFEPPIMAAGAAMLWGRRSSLPPP